MKSFRRVLIVLAVVAALVVGVEFGVRAFVQQQAQQALGSTDLALENPTMTLGGGSVLAAVVQGRFVDVSGTADAATVPVEDRQIPVRAVTYQASDIRLVSTDEAVIGRAEVRGTVSWASASELAGLPLAHAGDGRLLVTYRVKVLLSSVDIGISGLPVLDVAQQQLELQQARIEVAGVELTETMSQQIIDRVVRPISVEMDERARLTGIEATEAGLIAAVTTTELPVRR